MKVQGRLILDDRVVGGRITVEGDRISAVELDDNDDPIVKDQAAPNLHETDSSTSNRTSSA